MTDDIWRCSAPGLNVTCTLPEQVHMLRTRGVPKADLSRISTAMGLTLDLPPNSGGGEPRTLWMAPGEFLVLGQVDVTAMPAVDGIVHWADMTHATVAFQIQGEQARALLAKGCTLDLHPRTFPSGACSRTLFAQTSVIIDRPSDPGLFNLYAESSHTAHLKAWFEDALLEFQI